MTIIIVGAADIGLHLVELATKDGTDVAVIEEDSERADLVRATYDCVVVNDEPASMKTLQKAGDEQADALIASTERDEINITACLLGQELGIGKTASVINNGENRHLFQQFGIITIGNPHQLIAEHFYSSVTHPSISNRQPFGDTTEILEIQVGENAPIASCTIAEAATSRYLGDDVMVIAVHREGTEHNQIVPKGDTRLEAGDRVTLLSPSGTLFQVADVFE